MFAMVIHAASRARLLWWTLRRAAPTSCFAFDTDIVIIKDELQGYLNECEDPCYSTLATAYYECHDRYDQRRLGFLAGHKRRLTLAAPRRLGDISASCDNRECGDSLDFLKDNCAEYDEDSEIGRSMVDWAVEVLADRENQCPPQEQPKCRFIKASDASRVGAVPCGAAQK